MGGFHKLTLISLQIAQNLIKEVFFGESKTLPIDPRFGALFPPSLSPSLLPSPRISVCSLIPDKCKTMQSETVPLWLTFVNADICAPYSAFIFKVCVWVWGVCVWMLINTIFFKKTINRLEMISEKIFSPSSSFG